MSDETKVLAALASAGAAGLTQTEIRRDVLGGNRKAATLNELRRRLLEANRVECRDEAPAPGRDRPVLRWYEIAKTYESREPGLTNGDSRAKTYSGMDEELEPIEDWTPPDGEGWVEWKAVVRIAEAGVPYGPALRYGKKLRKKQHWTKAELAAIPDEQYAMYGERRISHAALKGAVYRGSIERRGEWCRLVQDPVVTQRMWMAAVYQVLGEAHPTLTGEFARKPPKTLASVMQEHLGRELLPEVFVRRRPGCAGSWDPADMKLHSRLLKPSDVEENERRLLAFRARMETAPEIQERPRFKARLPKQKRR